MQEKIKEIIKKAVEELNEQLEENKKIEYADDLKLMGKGAVLNSMDFVALITIIEELIGDEFDKDIYIVSDKAFSRENSPFRTMETLTNYVEELLKA